MLLYPICKSSMRVIAFFCSSDSGFAVLKVRPRRLKMEPSSARFLSG